MEKVQVLVDSFVDFDGIKHKFMIAAVSVKESDSYVTNDDYDEFDIAKSVRLGVSICNPSDKWDEETAYRIAVSRARENTEYALYATKGGMINTSLVTALLSQEAEYLKQNPGQYIPGYIDAKIKKERKEWKERAYKELKTNEQITVDTLRSMSQEDRQVIMSLI